MVAMEFAASFRPFRKSNTSATAMRKTRSASTPSDLLDDDAADAVRHVLETVHDLFEMVVDLDADDIGHRVAVAAMLLEQRLDACIVHGVGIVLQPYHLFGDRI